jgi:rubrerythrin
MSNTKDNLETAFAGESQANRKYLFFAEKAEMVRRYPKVCMEVIRNG